MSKALVLGLSALALSAAAASAQGVYMTPGYGYGYQAPAPLYNSAPTYGNPAPGYGYGYEAPAPLYNAAPAYGYPAPPYGYAAPIYRYDYTPAGSWARGYWGPRWKWKVIGKLRPRSRLAQKREVDIASHSLTATGPPLS